jgi:hypothetical protein
MRKSKYLDVLLSMTSLLMGTYLLMDSISNSGRYADECILIGAVLSALGLVLMSWSFERRHNTKAMQRHLRRA